MDEARLIEKLNRIEVLFAGATTDGERVAAGLARDRILAKLRATEVLDPPVEYRFSLSDVWSRRLFLALLRRYEIRPYRYSRQRRTTVMARVSKRFVDETLWPEFQQISETLRAYLSDVTDRIVGEVLHGDGSEAEVVEQPQLPFEPSAPADPPQPAAAPTPPASPPPAPPPPSSPSAADAQRKIRKKKKRKRR